MIWRNKGNFNKIMVSNYLKITLIVERQPIITGGIGDPESYLVEYGSLSI